MKDCNGTPLKPGDEVIIVENDREIQRGAICDVIRPNDSELMNLFPVVIKLPYVAMGTDEWAIAERAIKKLPDPSWDAIKDLTEWSPEEAENV